MCEFKYADAAWDDATYEYVAATAGVFVSRTTVVGTFFGASSCPSPLSSTASKGGEEKPRFDEGRGLGFMRAALSNAAEEASNGDVRLIFVRNDFFLPTFSSFFLSSISCVFFISQALHNA